MEDERFEESLEREKPKQPTIKLSDGREFTHKHIFDTFFKSGLKEDYMKEALYHILTDKPLTVELSNREVGRTIDFEVLIRRKHNISRKDSKEVKLVIDNIDSSDPRFYNALEIVGQCISLK